jgi:hypothetical protein
MKRESIHNWDNWNINRDMETELLQLLQSYKPHPNILFSPYVLKPITLKWLWFLVASLCLDILISPSVISDEYL